MKNSHITAPRSLSECNFQSWADPIEKPEHPHDSLAHYAVAVTLVLGFVVAMLSAVYA